MRLVKDTILGTLVLCLFSLAAQSQIVQPMRYDHYSFTKQVNVGVGTARVTAPSAYFEIGPRSGATKGMLPPVCTTAEMLAIPSPAAWLTVLNSDSATYYVYNPNTTYWFKLTGTGGAITNYADSLRRVGLNVQMRKNGNWTTQYIDSVNAPDSFSNGLTKSGGGTVKLGGTLTEQTTIDGNSNAFVLDYTQAATIFSREGNYIGGLFTEGGLPSLESQKSNDTISRITVLPDSIKIYPYNGSLFVDSIKTILSTTGRKVLIHDTATGKVERVDPALLGNNATLYKSGDSIYLNNGAIIYAVKDSIAGINNLGVAQTMYLDASTSFYDNQTLSPVPSSYPQETDVKAVTSATSPGFLERFVSGPVNTTSLPAGTWIVKTYGSTSNATGDNRIVTRINKRVLMEGMTGTFTGAGATRTFTVTGGTPFVPGDATSSILTASLIETPNQTAWISGYISSSVVTVTLTDVTYVNESNVSLNALYYLLFSTTSNDLTTSTTLSEISSAQSAFTVNVTDRLVAAYFATTDAVSSRNISLYHGGSVNYSNIVTTLASTAVAPVGNYGNVQINRNGVLATPASDSLSFTDKLNVKGNIVGTSKLILGATAAPAQSQVYVTGGVSGGNIDARGDSSSAQKDEANIEVQHADYDGSSFTGYGVALQANGNVSSGTLLGYSNRNSAQLRFTGNTNVIRTLTNASLRFGTNNIERMVLDSIGRLGIGVVNATATLDVSGTFKLVDGSQGDGKVLTSDANGGASWQTQATDSNYTAIATFTAGGGFASDTTMCTDSTLFGSFYTGQFDYTIAYVQAVIKGNAGDSIVLKLVYNDTFNVDGTKVNGAGLSLNNRYTGNTFTISTNRTVPANTWLWLKPEAVITGKKPKYISVTLVGYKTYVAP